VIDDDYLIEWSRKQQQRAPYTRSDCPACWHRFHGVRCTVDDCTCPRTPQDDS
jgi:hypothetical protein